MFNNYSLSDDDVMGIIEKYDNLINQYSEINRKIDEDLKQEIIITIYRKLTKNREK
ncbi:MAG: helix-turn-helix domain-containing protein [Clostridia bacterium]|nr:helix-turn-helix domain-containing protein [Clostridia bacterium]